MMVLTINSEQILWTKTKKGGLTAHLASNLPDPVCVASLLAKS